MFPTFARKLNKQKNMLDVLVKHRVTINKTNNNMVKFRMRYNYEGYFV